MVVCLTSARFTMQADILRSETRTDIVTPENPDGEWVLEHDPDSNEIIRVWKPAGDNPDTPDVVESNVLESFPCEARGIIGSGIRGVGATEQFASNYDAADYVRISFPASVTITRRDRVTNIRDRQNKVVWLEEERGDLAPTVFSVVGVTPVIAPFVGHVENMALLERVEVQ